MINGVWEADVFWQFFENCQHYRKAYFRRVVDELFVGVLHSD